MRVRVALPQFDPTGEAFDPMAFAGLALELAEVLVSQGPVLLLVPGPATAEAALRQLSRRPFSVRHHVLVSPLSLHGPPRTDGMDKMGGVDATEPPPAAVIIAGPTHSTNADDPSVVTARSWLRLGCEGLCTVVCLNARYSVRGAPIELNRFLTVYALLNYSVACPSVASDSGAMVWRGYRPVRTRAETDDEVDAVLLHALPGPWQLLLHVGSLGEPSPDGAAFEEVAALDERPDDGELDALLREGTPRPLRSSCTHTEWTTLDEYTRPWITLDEEYTTLSLCTTRLVPDGLPCFTYCPNVSVAAVERHQAARQALASAMTDHSDSPQSVAPCSDASAVAPSAGGLSAVALTWSQIEADGPVGGGIGSSTLQLYTTACLLRLRSLPSGSAGFVDDRRRIHLILPGDALVSHSGAALGTCLMEPDGCGERACRLEQLVIDASAGSSSGRYAAMLLAHAEREAARRGQRWLVSCARSGAAAPAGNVLHENEQWLRSVGFREAALEACPVDCAAAGADDKPHYLVKAVGQQ